ncbi:site-specific integrase, partial [Salmonella enterica]|nr:site-specific integrase [Salmonella enterica]
FEPLSKIFLGEEQSKNKKLFTEYILNSFGFFNDKNDQIECFTCKNFRAWSSQ